MSNIKASVQTKTALRLCRRAALIIEGQSLRDKRNFTRGTISEITNSRAYKPKHIVVIIIKSDFLAHDQYHPSYFFSAIAEIILYAICNCSADTLNDVQSARRFTFFRQSEYFAPYLYRKKCLSAVSHITVFSGKAAPLFYTGARDRILRACTKEAPRRS